MNPGGFEEVTSIPIMPQPFSSPQMNPVPKSLKKFYLGEPLALGITQIFIGLSSLAFGLVLFIQKDLSSSLLSSLASVCTGNLYIISGSLSVAAARKPKMSLVKGMLGMNVVSTVAAILALPIQMFFMRINSPYSHSWYDCKNLDSHLVQNCYRTTIVPRNTELAIQVVLLLFTVLEVCISLSTAAFGCKTLCRNAYSETVLVVYQNLTPSNAAPQPPSCLHPEIPPSSAANPPVLGCHSELQSQEQED